MTGESVTVGGRYQLGDVLGRGGMAEVRHAIDTRLGRPVAVKQLRTDLATDPTFQARFRREAQSAAGLNHPTIVAVYDTGEEPDARTGVSIPYIVMELVEGPTLRDVLRDGRKILPERALELTQGVLDALSYSHKAGIVHRDIKPANVMLTPTGGVKVMDFGIARAVADTSATMTQTAAVIGTAQYLSPEQARGETVDARSDIYSAGCLLYELLVGRPPFVGESPVSVAYQHVREAPVPPSELDPVITPEIDAVTLKALEKDRNTRYQSAREMKADITRLLAGQQVTAVVPMVTEDPNQTRVVPQVPIAPPPPEQEREAPLPDPDLEEDEEDEPKRRIGLGIFITVLILGLLGGAAYGLYQWMQPPETPAPQMVKVPAVLGYGEQEAESTLKNAQLVPDVKKVNGPEKGSGTITKQTPKAGDQVKANSSVALELNVGPKTATIPDNLIGKDVDKVKKDLKKAGFTNVTAEAATDEESGAKKDEVLTVTPDEGESAALDEDITVTFATGKSKMPSVLGFNDNGARQQLENAGFRGDVTTKEEVSDQPVGEVIDQNPEPGKMVARGVDITLTIAKPKPPPEPSDTPTPTKSPTASRLPTPTNSPSATQTEKSPSAPGTGDESGAKRPPGDEADEG